MFSIQPTLEQKTFAFAQAKTLAFGRRGTFDGKLEQQYAGVLGQTVLADALGAPRPEAAAGFDGGYDFRIDGLRTDLKTMLLTKPPRMTWSNNLYTGQIHFAVEVYIFGSVVKSEHGKFYCHGFMPRTWIDHAKYLVRAGTPRPRDNGKPLILPVDTIEIPMTDLWPVGTVEELVDKISHL